MTDEQDGYRTYWRKIRFRGYVATAVGWVGTMLYPGPFPGPFSEDLLEVFSFTLFGMAAFFGPVIAFVAGFKLFRAT